MSRNGRGSALFLLLVLVPTGGLAAFVVVWQSSLQDGSSVGVFYGPIVPVELMRFRVE